MEPVAKWILGLDGVATLLFTILGATEWVGVAVLLFALTAVWTSFRGSLPGWHGPPPRIVGLSSLATILLGIWVGVSVHLPLGAVILAVGCGLSFWSLLLRFGVGWRQHIRPGMAPASLSLVWIAGFYLQPRFTSLATLVLGYWAYRTLRMVSHSVDRQLNAVSTRALALTKAEAVAYLVNAWFQRFAPHADNLSLLVLARQARERSIEVPRARSLVHTCDALRQLTILAEGALDQRLRTDGAALRGSSQVRVLVREFFRQFIHRSGLVRLFGLISDLVLAVPPPGDEIRNDRDGRGGVPLPDADGYVFALVAGMPVAAHPAEISELRDRITRDADAAGADWLAAIAARSESWREETPNFERDMRVEVVTEVLWGVYEATIGPRPSHYDLYDQVRLQTPELVERSSIRQVKVLANSLVMQLNGMPRSYQDLGRSFQLIVQTPDDRIWCFQRLETSEAGVELIFSLDGTQPVVHQPVTKKPYRRKSRRSRKKVSAALAAAATQ